jgi:hypothetical protein
VEGVSVAALVTVEGAAIVLLAVLVAGLLRSHAQILATLHQLGAEPLDGGGPGPVPVAPPRLAPVPPRPPGGVVTDLAGVTPFDETVSVAVSATAVDTLLAFLSSGCSTCEALWRGLGDGEGPVLPDRSRVVVVTLGPGEESPSRLRRLAPPGAPVVMSSDAWQDYRVPGAPYFIWVQGSSGQVLGEGSARTWAEVTSLLGEAAAERATAGSQAREADADAELAAAGILPGDPRLYHPPGTGTAAQDAHRP